MHVCQIFRFLPMASEQSHNMVYSTVDAVMANPEAFPRACFLYQHVKMEVCIIAHETFTVSDILGHLDTNTFGLRQTCSDTLTTENPFIQIRSFTCFYFLSGSPIHTNEQTENFTYSIFGNIIFHRIWVFSETRTISCGFIQESVKKLQVYFILGNMF